MPEDVDIVVIAGGKGQRIESLTSRYQCKSLIPLRGRPAIEYVLRAIRQATSGRIILCADRRPLVAPLGDVIARAGINNVQFYMDNGRGPMPAMNEVSGFCKAQKLLVLFGHHLVTATHLRKLLAIESCAAAVSLFATSSESHCKIASLDAEGRCQSAARFSELVPLKSAEYYVDLPYVLPIRFFQDTEYSTVKKWFIKGNMAATSLGSDEPVFGVVADFPHEFHRLSDMPDVEEFAARLFCEETNAPSWLA